MAQEPEAGKKGSSGLHLFPLSEADNCLPSEPGIRAWKNAAKSQEILLIVTEDGLFRLGLWIFYVGFIKTNALSAIAVEAGVQPQEFFQIRLFHSFQLQEIFTGLQFLIQIQDREISEGRGQIVFFVTRFQIRLIESSAIILIVELAEVRKLKNSQRISGSSSSFSAIH